MNISKAITLIGLMTVMLFGCASQIMVSRYPVETVDRDKSLVTFLMISSKPMDVIEGKYVDDIKERIVQGKSEIATFKSSTEYGDSIVDPDDGR